jgi:Protein of unknown function (DUF4435)
MLNRTSSGIKNIHLFYPDYYLVIVEGSSDRPFWSKFFPDELNGYKRKFKPVVGRPEVERHIKELLQNEAKFAVAIDSDYRLIINKPYENPRIVETQYHSIENLMLCSSVMTSIIRNLSHDTEYNKSVVNNWLEHFDSATHSLMVADVIVEKHNLRKDCVGDNCSRFLIKNQNPQFDPSKIDDFIAQLDLPEDQFIEMQAELKNYKSRFHIRGHFLFSAILCFISHEVKKVRKKVTISNDSLYSMLIEPCESRIAKDPILQSLRDQAHTAADVLTNLLSQ